MVGWKGTKKLENVKFDEEFFSDLFKQYATGGRLGKEDFDKLQKEDHFKWNLTPKVDICLIM